MFKNILLSIGGLILFLGLIFCLGFYQLGWMKFFNPKYENVKREVFENTKSYTHGKIQDLAKYYDEYQQSEDKEAISAIIKMRFAEFPTDRIDNYKLKMFLTEMRGY